MFPYNQTTGTNITEHKSQPDYNKTEKQKRLGLVWSHALSCDTALLQISSRSIKPEAHGPQCSPK